METILFFTLGYIVASLLRPASGHLKPPDRVLKWDSKIFAWRPISPGTSIEKSTETLLFAYEVESQNLSEINEKR